MNFTFKTSKSLSDWISIYKKLFLIYKSEYYTRYRLDNIHIVGIYKMKLKNVKFKLIIILVFFTVIFLFLYLIYTYTQILIFGTLNTLEDQYFQILEIFCTT